MLKVKYIRLRAFFHEEEVRKGRKTSLQTKIRILEAAVMTVVKYGSEAWTLRKADEDLLDVSRKIAYGLFWVPG